MDRRETNAGWRTGITKTLSKRRPQGSGLGVLAGGYTHLYMCQRQPAAALSDGVISANHGRKLPPGSGRVSRESTWGCFLCVLTIVSSVSLKGSLIQFLFLLSPHTPDTLNSPDSRGVLQSTDCIQEECILDTDTLIDKKNKCTLE